MGIYVIARASRSVSAQLHNGWVSLLQRLERSDETMSSKNMLARMLATNAAGTALLEPGV